MSEEKVSQNEEQKDEGAPLLETPEGPSEPPVDAPRDEESELETPEAPKAHPKHRARKRAAAREETRAVTREEFTHALNEEVEAGNVKMGGLVSALRRPLPKAPDAQVIAQLAVSGPTVGDPYVTSLFQHVSPHPIDAHAPAWGARASNQSGANTSGGYS